MTKEEILKEFKRKFVVHCSDGDILDGMVDAKDVIKFLDKAIDKTREETIMEVESKISKIPKIEMTFSDIKDVLNKLKK